MIKAQFVLAGLETVFDIPALSFHRHQRLDAGASRAPGGEVGAFAISQIAPDQQAAGPQPALPVIVVAGIKIGQFQIRPVIQPRSRDYSRLVRTRVCGRRRRAMRKRSCGWLRDAGRTTLGRGAADRAGSAGSSRAPRSRAVAPFR
jgi:hypothetical protein